MNQVIIVYGPQCSGKTRNKMELADKYQCGFIMDDFSFPKESNLKIARVQEAASTARVLVLTKCDMKKESNAKQALNLFGTVTFVHINDALEHVKRVGEIMKAIPFSF